MYINYFIQLVINPIKIKIIVKNNCIIYQLLTIVSVLSFSGNNKVQRKKGSLLKS